MRDDRPRPSPTPLGVAWRALVVAFAACTFAVPAQVALGTAPEPVDTTAPTTPPTTDDTTPTTPDTAPSENEQDEQDDQDADDIGVAVVVGVIGLGLLVAVAAWWMVRHGGADEFPRAADDSAPSDLL